MPKQKTTEAKRAKPLSSVVFNYISFNDEIYFICIESILGKLRQFLGIC